MGSSLHKNFAMSEEKMKDGVDIEFSPNDDGSVPTFRIARVSANNPKYMKCMERVSRPYKRQIQLETLTPELTIKINRTVFVESLLLGWSNVQGKDGKEMSFSRENALKLLEELPDLFDELYTNANKASLFRDEEQEADAKN
jgi:hypothetical protein